MVYVIIHSIWMWERAYVSFVALSRSWMTKKASMIEGSHLENGELTVFVSFDICSLSAITIPTYKAVERKRWISDID